MLASRCISTLRSVAARTSSSTSTMATATTYSSSLFRQAAVTATATRALHASSPLSRFRILISDPIEDVCTATLRDQGYTVDLMEKVPPAELIKIMPQYDGLIVRSGTTVTADVINAGSRLKVIGRAGTGVDNINVDTATMKGVMVMNTPGGNTVSAAELSVSLLMSLSRNIPSASESLKAGRWDRKKYMGTELSGKVMGIVGLGQIGRRVAQICQGIGMRVIGYDPLMSKAAAAQYGIELVDMNGLTRRSNCVSLHTPLTPETRGLFNDESFEICQPGLLIVNCARGGIIDEAALLRGLESGKVAGAALDVYATEPPPESTHALLAHPNVICTPHLGASTEEAQEKVATEIATQLVDALEGRQVRGVVNSRILAEFAVRKDLHEYIHLAERLGSLQAQLLGGTVKSISLTTRGSALKDAGSLLTTAALKGILSQMVTEDVNFVNAPTLAQDFGLQINETHEYFPSLYGDSVALQFETTDGTVRRLTGTVVGDNGRIVEVNEQIMDVMPYGHCLFFDSVDRPGVLAHVTKVLSSHNLNVTNFALGRSEKGGACVGVVGIDGVNDDMDTVCAELAQHEGMRNVRVTSLPGISEQQSTSTAHRVPPPAVRPASACFSSGPTKKRPGYDPAALKTRVLGRSHRSAPGKQVIQECVQRQRELLGIPEDYHVGIIAGSDTGAFEAAMWSMLGARPVDVVQFESFGKGWATDIEKHLKLDDVRVLSADYGQVPDLSQTNSDHDIVFTWNGTTSGARVPDGDWIAADRAGLTLCDATSAVFCQELPWDKLDVTTYSWQKALGGEGGHGMMVLSPRAVERLNTFEPQNRPLPKIFRLTKGGKFNESIFQASTINTPSMLAIEDCIDALQWVDDLGGRHATIQRSNENLAVLERFVEQNDWIDFLCQDPKYRSNTSVCLTLTCSEEECKQMVALLSSECVAFDIGKYRDVEGAGLRVWCGATVDSADVRSLTDWLTWARAMVLMA